MKIAFLGLGIMGSRMARNLSKHEVDLTVWNRSEEPRRLFAELGVKAADTPAEAVKDADLVFSMLSNPDAVEGLFFGEDGLLTEMKQGAIWADCSTVNPSFSRRSGEEARARGIRFMDTPVAGSKAAAESAGLVFFCGGDEDDYKTILPYAEMMGSKGMHLGKVGQAASLKMLVNVMLAQSMTVFSEAVLLGEKLDLDRNMLLSMLPNLPVIASFTQHKNEAMRAMDFSDVHFPLEHMHKDVRLATETAKEVGMTMHLAEATKELYAQAKDAGMSREDFGAIYKYLGKN